MTREGFGCNAFETDCWQVLDGLSSTGLEIDFDKGTSIEIHLPEEYALKEVRLLRANGKHCV